MASSWAAAFPLTPRRIARPIARARLFDLVAGFVYSQVLLACVRLNLFEILAEGPQTAAADRRPLRPAAGRRRAAARRRRLAAAGGSAAMGGRYGLGALGAPMVGNRACCAMVEHHAVLYADLQDPLRCCAARAAGGAVALLGLRHHRAPGRLPPARGRVFGADVGLAAAGRRAGAGRLPDRSATAACSTSAAARAASSPRRRGARRICS
jgi:hypothetical protein